MSDRQAWRCRLATGARLRESAGRCFLVRDSPLAVLEVRQRGQRLLERLPPGQGVTLQAPASVELRFLRRLAELGLVELAAVPERWPPVSVVIPVRDRQAQLDACLRSLDAQDYPGPPPAVVVVDDGSARPAGVPPGVRLVRLPRPGGPAAARNAGVAACRSELVAFLDSDCLAEPGWLTALAAELADPDVAAAGGRVLPARERGWLERYEAVRSPLDLGAARVSARPRRPVPYLVTANLLVRRAALEAVGGFDQDLARGEDVDLSWRLAAAGHRLAYQPAAAVRHDHRGRLGAFLATRAGYAASEAALLRRHPGNGRWLGFSPGMAALLAGAAGALLGRPGALAAGGLALGLEVAGTTAKLDALGVPSGVAAWALLRGQGGGFYHVARQVARYYGLAGALTIAAVPAGRPKRRLALALVAAAVVPAVVDWRRLRPRLSLPAFVAAHVLDDVAYQVGLLRGCVRERSAAALDVELRLVDGRAE